MNSHEPPDHIQILVIDDDVIDRQSVRRSLLASGMQATLIEADSSESAWPLLSQGTFDCILLDYQLPQINGGEVLRRMRAEGMLTPVIILTGHGDEQVAVELMKAGASDYLPKARLTGETLASSIRHTLRLARLEQQARAAQTRQQQAEAALRQQEQLLAGMLKSIGDAVVATDAAGHITFLNRGAELLTGWSVEEAIGQPIQQILPLFDATVQTLMVHPVDEVLRRGVAVEHHHLLLTSRQRSTHIPVASTSAPIVGVNGAIDGVVSVVRDMTAQVQAAERLQLLAAMNEILVASLDYQENLRQLAHLIVRHNADYCAVDIRQRQGGIERIALAMSNIIAAVSAIPAVSVHLDDPYGAAEVLRTARPVYYPDIHQELGDQLRSDHQAFLAATNLTSWISVPLLVRGELLGMISIGRHASRPPFSAEDVDLIDEIARRTALATDNALLYQQAQEAIYTRDAFLSVATHELKNPLAAILSYSQLLERRMQRDGQLVLHDQPMLEKMTEQIRRLNRLIQSLFDVSRLQIGQLTLDLATLDLGELTDEVIQTLEPTLERHTIRFTLGPGPLLVMADALRIEQAISNLLQNAIKYSPEGGSIPVEVHAQEQWVVLSVQDEGIGIPETALDSIFQRFYRASNTNIPGLSGIGVGLYVVRQIVDLHHGRVEVNSREGEGSTFRVWIPRADADPGA